MECFTLQRLACHNSNSNLVIKSFVNVLSIHTHLLYLALPAIAAEQVVKIGHVAPLAGGIAHLGKKNESGARLAVEEINAKGLLI